MGDENRHLVDGRYSISDLVDIDRLRAMFDRFSLATGFTTGLLSYPGNELLFSTGWRDICTRFHRVFAPSEAHCKQGILELTSDLKEPGKANICRCENGLVNGAMAIIVRGVHVAEVFTGQVFLARPDPEVFKEQGQAHGYDVAAYLAALAEVPLVTEEALEGALTFLSEITVMLAEQGLTELRTGSARAAEGEERYRDYFNNSLVGLFRSRISDGLFIEINAKAAQQMRLPIDEIVGKLRAVDLYRNPDQRSELIGLLERNGEAHDFEPELRLYDGSDATFSVSVKAYPDRDYMEGALIDITERKQAEAELLREKVFSDAAIASLPGIFYVYDEHGKCLRWNRNFETVSGYSGSEIARMRPEELFPPEQRPLVSRVIQEVLTAGWSAFEGNFMSKDGSTTDYYLTGARFEVGGTLCFAGMGVDIGERKRAEEERLSLQRQVQHTQKLESLAVLAGGVAHDFNNLLMAILANAELAITRLPPDSGARDNISEIEQASRRAAELAKQMLAYSGRGRFVIESIDLGKLVGEMAHLLDVSISKKALLELDLDDNLPSIDGDATQIRQIIMNLITNAAEAIAEQGGVITLSTGVTDCDRAYLDEVIDIMRRSADGPLPEGVYVYLDVADTGCGMNAATIEKVFDPFFTTKFTGRGLGMAAVLGIVRGHQGAIMIDSEFGRGTTFRVIFPVSESTGQGEAIQPPDLGEALPGSGRGTVLIVDDDEAVCLVGKAMVSRLGFSVLTATDGRQAVEIFHQHGSEIVCVVLDLTMPHMDGEQAYGELRSIRPDVAVILCSGFDERDATVGFEGLAGFIQKPYDLATLGEKLKEALADPTSPGAISC